MKRVFIITMIFSTIFSTFTYADTICQTIDENTTICIGDDGQTFYM